ncbi:hypothetical protein CJF30_00002418 [Rutstroemia sp. NJR-2017a BBW]|nr:hypothetical protein CJF30_00002418 [Rutstroemia sp. NJR-2017a BBW]
MKILELIYLVGN